MIATVLFRGLQAWPLMMFDQDGQVALWFSLLGLTLSLAFLPGGPALS